MRLEQAYAALRFDPTVPGWLLVALAVLCLLALAPAALKRARGTVWRALAFAVLLLWLAGPRLVQETRETLRDIALLVLDESASMGVGERAALRDAARARLTEAAGRLPDLDLRTITVPEAGRDGTRLFAAIDRALADIPRARLSAVVAVTDGQVHDIPQAPAPGGDAPNGAQSGAQAQAGAAGGTPPAPLHVLIPARGEEVDRRVRIVEAPSFGLVGRSVTLRVAVDDLGPVRAGGTARLTVRRDGEPPRTETVPVGREHRVEVPIARAGPVLVELQADPLPGEVSELNNRAVVEINGVRDRLRVLLVSGEPHMGERTWRRLLKADPAVDLVHFTILRPPERDDMTPLNELALIAFPVRELFQVKIRDFDLIILDRFSNRGLLPPTYLRNIAEYVRGGGGLLLSVGPEFVGPSSLAATPLGGVLPARPAGGVGVAEGPFRPAVTELGVRHPVTEALPGWRASGEAAWGRWYRRVEAASAEGQSLMNTPDGAPLLLLDRVDQGRTALLLSDQIWLWSRGHDGGGPQAELLRRIAHWLMKEPALEEEALRARIEGGTLRVERRTVAEDAGEEVVVTDPAGRTTPLRLTPAGPGRAAAEMPATLPGVWQASDGTRTAFAAAGAANPAEIADLRATAGPLGPVARASGGGTRFIGAGLPELRRVEPGRDASGGGWIGLPRRHDHVVTGLDAIPLLPPWVALPLVLGLAVVAWRREGAG